MDDKCAMCGTAIHSISTRRAGDYLFCIQCGDDIVLPVVNACANAHAEALIIQYQREGYKLTRIYAEGIAEELATK
jgi:hypothetical protein